MKDSEASKASEASKSSQATYASIASPQAGCELGGPSAGNSAANDFITKREEMLKLFQEQ